MAVAHIVEVKTKLKNNQLEPYRVSFDHANLIPEHNDEMKVGIFQDNNSKKDTVLICQSGEISYQGSTANEDKNQKYFIAVRNKDTHKTKLVEVSKVSLAPTIVYPDTTNEDLVDDEIHGKKSYKELNKEFVHKFGMLKGIRLYEQAERLTVKADRLKDKLENAAQKSTVEAEDLVVKTRSDYDYLLPPRDVNATSPSAVYQLKDIITEEDFESLAESVEACIGATNSDLACWKKDQRYSSFFLKNLDIIRQMKTLSDEVKANRVATLIYMECLIKLSQVKGYMLRKGQDPLPNDFPSDLRSRILEKFVPRGSGNSRDFSQKDQQRVVCHVIVLALIIRDGKVDAKILCDSLHIRGDDLISLVKIVGAHYDSSKAEGTCNINLRLPLASATAGRGPMKRGGKPPKNNEGPRKTKNDEDDVNAAIDSRPTAPDRGLAKKNAAKTPAKKYGGPKKRRPNENTTGSVKTE